MSFISLLTGYDPAKKNLAEIQDFVFNMTSIRSAFSFRKRIMMWGWPEIKDVNVDKRIASNRQYKFWGGLTSTKNVSYEYYKFM